MSDRDIARLMPPKAIRQLDDTAGAGRTDRLGAGLQDVRDFAGLDFFGQGHIAKAVRAAQAATRFRMGHFPYGLPGCRCKQLPGGVSYFLGVS